MFQIGTVNGLKVLFAQFYSIQSKQFSWLIVFWSALSSLYDRFGDALHTPPCPGNFPHASANVS
jgi:hypothetical protein